MKTPLEMLQSIIDMQENTKGYATVAHIRLDTLCKEAKDVIKNHEQFSKPNKNMKQVKLFQADSHLELEDDINEWLTAQEVGYRDRFVLSKIQYNPTCSKVWDPDLGEYFPSTEYNALALFRIDDLPKEKGE